MSLQDKLEGILRQIHLVLAKGPIVSSDADQVVVSKREILGILEQLNLTVYEMMDAYEVTNQSREMAQRRSEKKAEELVEKVSGQTEDIYAASLMYTYDALSRVTGIMEEAMAATQGVFKEAVERMEEEKLLVKENQLELHAQFQDFKDGNKYLNLLAEYNREQKRKEERETEKCIQNEAKHYPMSGRPQIRVNPEYYKKQEAIQQIQSADLDAEYFGWQSQQMEETESEDIIEEGQKKERKKFLFKKGNVRKPL